MAIAEIVPSRPQAISVAAARGPLTWAARHRPDTRRGLFCEALKTGRLVADHAPSRRIDFATHLPSRYEDLMIMRPGIERAMMRRLN